MGVVLPMWNVSRALGIRACNQQKRGSLLAPPTSTLSQAPEVTQSAQVHREAPGTKQGQRTME